MNVKIPTRFLFVSSVVAVIGAVSFMISRHDNRNAEETTISQPVSEIPLPKGFEGVREVFSGKGGRLEFQLTIGVLDAVSRKRVIMREETRAWLIQGLGEGTPQGMTVPEWEHLFNSTCNALGTGDDGLDDAFLELLVAVAQDDPNQVLRLYALQHLGFLYTRVNPMWQQRLRDVVVAILSDPASDTVGTALVLWKQWESDEPDRKISADTMSLAVAADTSNPVNVRVNALQVAGSSDECLPLARQLAGDTNSHFLLRKGALYLLGRHGGAEDLALLERCAEDHPRLMQASEPAARALEARLAGRSERVLHPYR